MQNVTKAPEDILAAIQKIEADLGLLERHVGGVFYWPLVRVHVYQRLCSKLVGMQAHHPTDDRDLGRRLRKAASIPSALWSAVSRRADTVVIAHPRRRMFNGDYLDPYTHDITDSRSRTVVIDLPDVDGGYRAPPARRHIRAGALDLVAGGLARMLRHAGSLLTSARREKNDLDAAFQEALGVHAPITHTEIAERIHQFRIARRFYRGLFTKLGARELYVVVAYFRQAQIAAARDLGIPVRELQHGIITAGHPGYAYPGRPAVSYAPDELWLFGRFWADSCDLPACMITRVVGAPWGHPTATPGEARQARTACIISQGAIGREIRTWASALALARPDWTFRVFLHPSEKVSGPAEAYALPDNLVIAGTDESLIEAQRTSQLQIGVFSTALFEGMSCGTATVILDLPGRRNMDRAIARGDAVLARSPAEAAARLEDAPVAQHPEDYYAERLRAPV